MLSGYQQSYAILAEQIPLAVRTYSTVSEAELLEFGKCLCDHFLHLQKALEWDCIDRIFTVFSPWCRDTPEYW